MAVQNWTSGFEGTPAGSDNPAQGDDRIRELKETIRAVIDKEHVLDPGASQVVGDQGWHKAGSAKVYSQSAAPTNRPDGTTALDADDEGRLWVDSDTGVLHVWDGTSWEISGSDQDLLTTSDVTFNTVTANVTGDLTGDIIGPSTVTTDDLTVDNDLAVTGSISTDGGITIGASGTKITELVIS